jgi:predicted nucleotidyltransferase
MGLHKDNKIDDIISMLYRFYSAEFGNKLKEIILYGSYARGDYDDESDVDIMVLVDANGDETNLRKDKFSRFSSELSLDFDIMVSPVLHDTKIFYDRAAYVPFYKVVNEEGVHVNA